MIGLGGGGGMAARLQSQIEPDLKDIHLKFTEFCTQE